MIEEKIKKTMEGLFVEKKCQQCGEKILIHHGWAEQYAYQLKTGKGRKFYCSYHCYKPNRDKAKPKFCYGERR